MIGHPFSKYIIKKSDLIFEFFSVTLSYQSISSMFIVEADNIKLNLLINLMNLDLEHRSSSPEPEEPSIHQTEESFDFLVSKHLIPPPLMLLPKPVSHKPKSLTPMIPLPSFVGIIPNFQPLDKPVNLLRLQQNYEFSWIGQAFQNVIYRKYEQQSYKKIDNIDENWNIWACDINKITGRKSADDNTNDSPILSYYTPKGPLDKTLIFQSRFQCGNLSLVSKVSDNQYNLLLQNDINTSGYSQWFFFKVMNTTKGEKVRFNILNQYKLNNLYKMGMKIIIYSKRQSEQKNLSWHRGGDNIQYYQNGYSKSSTQYKPYFTLSWDYIFQYSSDQVYFAYSYPYTYSNLQNFFQKIESDTYLRSICQRSPLCKTLAGNHVDILTITENHQHLQLDKGYIIITARIHPGQSVSSYVCNGIVQFLLSNDDKAKKLRQNFIFKIIPMMNPDGVIHGNYRSNISGYDLNRKWENPSKIYHPEIFYLKKLILSIEQVGEIVLFCDLHGHSMKKNAFIYGCHDSVNPRKGKQFPLLMSKIFKGFSFKDCSFLDLQEQEGTSRTFLSKQLRHCDIYALESSFCGPQYQNIHFTVRHFEQLGEKFCEALLIHFSEKIKNMHVEAAMREKSYFPNHQDSFESLPQLRELKNFEELDYTVFQDRVNSENSQLSEEQIQTANVLEERIIKKYLMLRYMRPGTNMKRNNILIRRKDTSKDGTKMKLGDFLNTKSSSPIKRKELYETPVKAEKPKITLKFCNQKKEVQPKLFEPIDIVPLGKEKKRHQSMGKIIYETQKIVKIPEKNSIKIVLNKNFQFKQKEEKAEEPFFKNNFLKGLAKQESKTQKKMNEFLIRKKIPYSDEKNSVNLFNSVLSSLRKDRK